MREGWTVNACQIENRWTHTARSSDQSSNDSSHTRFCSCSSSHALHEWHRLYWRGQLVIGWTWD